MRERINGVRLHLESLSSIELANLINLTALNIEQATDELARLMQVAAERDMEADLEAEE